MDLYLQFGYGMMALSEELLGAWHNGGVVLSPRDLTVTQLKSVADAARKANAEPLLDPQCFAHDADWEKLNAKEYWQEYRASPTGSLIAPEGAGRVLGKLAELSNDLGLARHIVPGMLAETVNDDWFAIQEMLIGEAPRYLDDDPLLATVALSRGAMVDEAQIEAIVDRAAEWKVSGFYVVAETPGDYLVDDPNWLANLLILVSGLKLLGRYVLVGYSHHQMLGLAATKADSVASGTWQNVRAFNCDKFYIPDADDVSRRAKGGWFYCPKALSEYKMNFLDVAQRTGVLAMMKPDPSLGCTFSDALFAGPRPSSIDWGEPNAFRHYLTCLRVQLQNAVKATFQETVDEHYRLLDEAEHLIRALKTKGVYGTERDFADCIDVNRSALQLFVSARAPRLRRNW